MEILIVHPNPNFLIENFCDALVGIKARMSFIKEGLSKIKKKNFSILIIDISYIIRTKNYPKNILKNHKNIFAENAKVIVIGNGEAHKKDLYDRDRSAMFINWGELRSNPRLLREKLKI